MLMVNTIYYILLPLYIYIYTYKSSDIEILKYILSRDLIFYNSKFEYIILLMI